MIQSGFACKILCIVPFFSVELVYDLATPAPFNWNVIEFDQQKLAAMCQHGRFQADTDPLLEFFKAQCEFFVARGCN